MTMHIFIQNVDSKDVQFTCPPYTAGPTLLPRPWTRFRTFLEGIPGLPVQLLSGTCGAQDTGGQARPGRSLRSAATARAPETAPSGAESQPPAARAASCRHARPSHTIPCHSVPCHVTPLPVTAHGRPE